MSNKDKMVKSMISNFKYYHKDDYLINNYEAYIYNNINEIEYLNNVEKKKGESKFWIWEENLENIIKENDIDFLDKNIKLLYATNGIDFFKDYIKYILREDQNILIDQLKRNVLSRKEVVNIMYAIITDGLIYRQNVVIHEYFIDIILEVLNLENSDEILKELQKRPQLINNTVAKFHIIQLLNLIDYLYNKDLDKRKEVMEYFNLDINDPTCEALLIDYKAIHLYLCGKYIGEYRIEEKEIISNFFKEDSIKRIDTLYEKLNINEIVYIYGVLKKCNVEEEILFLGLIRLIYPYSEDENIINASNEVIEKTYKLAIKEDDSLSQLYLSFKYNLKLEKEREELFNDALKKKISRWVFIKDKQALVEAISNGEEIKTYDYSIDNGFYNDLRFINVLISTCYDLSICKNFIKFIYNNKGKRISNIINEILLNKVKLDINTAEKSLEYYKSLGISKEKWFSNRYDYENSEHTKEMWTSYIKENYDFVFSMLSRLHSYYSVECLRRIKVYESKENYKLYYKLLESDDDILRKYAYENLKGNNECLKYIENSIYNVNNSCRTLMVKLLIEIDFDNKEKFLEEILTKEKNKTSKNLIERYLSKNKIERAFNKANSKNEILDFISSYKENDKVQCTFNIEKLSILKWDNDEEVSLKVSEFIIKSFIRHKEIVKYNDLEKLIIGINKRSVEEFVFSAFNAWLNNDAPVSEKGILLLAAQYGSEECLNVICREVKNFADNSRHAMAIDCLKALTLSKLDIAIRLINSIALKFKYKKIREYASFALEEIASNRGLNREQLEDKIVPDFGFSYNSTKIFDYGSRKFEVKLGIDNTLEVFNEEGKKLKSIPKPGARDNEILAKESEKEFKLIKKQLKNTINMQINRLENVMLNRRRWSLKSWKELFVENTIMKNIATSLIWAQYNNEGLVQSFRYTEDGEYVDCNDESIELIEDLEISLLHPIEISEKVKGLWKEQLEDYNIKTPFNQLDRKLYVLTEEEGEEKEYRKFEDIIIDGPTFYQKISKSQWTRGDIYDAGVFEDVEKQINRDLKCIIETEGIPVGYYDDYNTKILNVRFYLKNNNIILAKIDKATISEVLSTINMCIE